MCRIYWWRNSVQQDTPLELLLIFILKRQRIAWWVWFTLWFSWVRTGTSRSGCCREDQPGEVHTFRRTRTRAAAKAHPMPRATSPGDTTSTIGQARYRPARSGPNRSAAHFRPAYNLSSYQLPQDFILSPVRTTTGGLPGILSGPPRLRECGGEAVHTE